MAITLTAASWFDRGAGLGVAFNIGPLGKQIVVTAVARPKLLSLISWRVSAGLIERLGDSGN
jgi:hypothetical protein